MYFEVVMVLRACISEVVNSHQLCVPTAYAVQLAKMYINCIKER
jgi:hypothetical protein